MSAGMSAGASAADGEDALDEDGGDGEEDDDEAEEFPSELVDVEVFSTWILVRNCSLFTSQIHCYLCSFCPLSRQSFNSAKPTQEP